MESSLSPNRINELPDVYHRPQVGSGVKIISERKIKNFDTHEGYGVNGRLTSFENPAVNSLDTFIRPLLDNFNITKKFVMNMNYAYRRGKSKIYLARLAAQYAEMLVKHNTCHLCRKPIKVTKAAIVSLKDAVTEDKTLDPNKVVELRNENLKKGIKSSVSYPSTIAGKRVKVEFRGLHKKPSVGAITETYADITPHYEFRRKPTGKLAFVFVTAIDGKRVELTVERRGDETTYFLDGEKIKHIPPSSFRIFTEPCKCRTECLNCEKTFSLHSRHICKIQ